MKKLIIQIGIVVSLLAIIYFLYQRNKTLKSESDRKSVNITALTSELEITKTKANDLMVTNKQLLLTKKEIEDLYQETAQKLKEANIKLKNVQSITDVTIGGNVDTTTVVIYDTIGVEPIIKAGFHNKWYDAEVKIENKLADWNISCRHDITLVLQNMKYKCRWLFWKRPVEAQVNVILSNDKDTVTKLQTIQLWNKKKKK
nr:MAG TPA: hypothetical protein [Caudoviricetes sp.]